MNGEELYSKGSAGTLRTGCACAERAHILSSFRFPRHQISTTALYQKFHIEKTQLKTISTIKNKIPFLTAFNVKQNLCPAKNTRELFTPEAAIVGNLYAGKKTACLTGEKKDNYLC